jgi:hypothetical protein
MSPDRGLSASYHLLVKNEWQNVPIAELVRAQLAHFGNLLKSRIAARGTGAYARSRDPSRTTS